MPKLSSKIDFAKRRKQFLKSLGRSVAIFPAAPQLFRNSDVHHPYRQDSNFYYLTGFEEDDSICLFDPNSKTPFQMFVPPKDKVKELWIGAIHGPSVAKSKFGANLALPSTPDSHFNDAFVKAMEEADGLFYKVGVDAAFDQKIFKLLQQSMKEIGRTGRPMFPIRDPQEILGEMRLVKTPAEIERLKTAVDISARSHVNAMKVAAPGMHEFEVEADLFKYFRAHGAGRLGYPSIVASGPNACVLHYHNNSRVLQKNDLLLIDAGAEYDYYTADITRTFPVRRKFSKEERDIYQAVLKTQLACIKMAKPGTTMNALHKKSVEILVEELKKLKVLKGASKKLIDDETYKNFYPHGIGHWLGMDVHDVGRYYVSKYDNHRKLEPGMTLTIEPGLYFGPFSKGPAKYKGIGVRIEDDILITKNGCQVLSKDIPKEIEEVEKLCAS